MLLSASLFPQISDVIFSNSIVMFSNRVLRHDLNDDNTSDVFFTLSIFDAKSCMLPIASAAGTVLTCIVFVAADITDTVIVHFSLKNKGAINTHHYH
ncbi:hypothetical protein [Morganella sp. GD04133]|uniref:hypothetical protein n=1 Tax=Morganella sp. GD04133 TaxID=2975435 RepID=UPI00244869DA|nr:hypothetical protein [Morganella sp. GD04133]MDH0353629.1 hypothetical protein [Morganella sp. GD04133]